METFKKVKKDLFSILGIEDQFLNTEKFCFTLLENNIYSENYESIISVVYDNDQFFKFYKQCLKKYSFNENYIYNNENGNFETLVHSRGTSFTDINDRGSVFIVNSYDKNVRFRLGYSTTDLYWCTLLHNLMNGSGKFELKKINILSINSSFKTEKSMKYVEFSDFVIDSLTTRNLRGLFSLYIETSNEIITEEECFNMKNCFFLECYKNNIQFFECDNTLWGYSKRDIFSTFNKEDMSLVYPPISFEKKYYNVEVINLFQRALLTIDITYQYICFYQVIEAYFDEVNNDSFVEYLRQKIGGESEILNYSDEILERKISYYKINWSEDRKIPIKKFKIIKVLEKYLDKEILKDNLDWEYYSTKNPDFIIDTNFSKINRNELFDSLAERFNKIRNSLSHSEQYFEKNYKIYDSDHEKQLIKEIILIKKVAEYLIENSAKDKNH